VTAESCPVPPEQRPLQEYQQLCNSWFFAWPCTDLGALLRPLIISWLLLLPLTLLVATGSWTLRSDPARLVLLAALSAMALPALLLFRQWLGWNYVHRRLLSEAVDYEESGWHDGNVWRKPLAWQQQDLLVATHQVRPVLVRLRQGLGLTVTALLLGAGLCQAL
jgi:hypothetical protein